MTMLYKLRFARAVLLLVVISSYPIKSFGQKATEENKPQDKSVHNQVNLSEQVGLHDEVTAKLTPGQRRAIARYKDLEPDKSAIFKSDGTLIEKGSTKVLEKVFGACKDLQPISDKCWVCKDNGKIFCSRVPPKKSEHEDPTSQMEPRSP